MERARAEPTDEQLFDLAETLLGGVTENIRADPDFIRDAVLEHRHLWALLYEAHHYDVGRLTGRLTHTGDDDDAPGGIEAAHAV